MTIKVTYNVTDVYVSETISATYINISYEAPMGAGAVWGSITGTLSNQTDLQNALNAKFDDPTGTTSQYLRGDGTLATFPSLTGFVPYTGATTNVDLGEFEIKGGQLTLDTSPTGTAAVATTRWNDTNGVSETTLKGGSVVLKNGIDLVARVVNKVTPNATLTKAAYQAVRVSGAQGQRLAVAYAQANNDANSADTIGLVCETIATNQEGFIMAVGQLENINTTGSLQGETWVDGDVLYLSPFTAGALTKVKPTGNGHIVVIGYVEYAHVNNGKIYVKVMNGWELDELHDVSIVTPLNNEALIYETATALWKNKSIATALGYTPEQPLTFTTPLSRATNTISIPQATGSVSGFLSSTDWTTFNSKQNALTNPITGTGTSGQVAYFTGTTTQAGNSDLFWDNTNERLGIGTATPQQGLSIIRTENTSSGIETQNLSTGAAANSGIIVRNSASSGQLFKLGTGYVSYKTLVASDLGFYNAGGGDISILNETSSGKIKFLSGNISSTAQMTLTANGRLLLGSTTEGTQILQVTGDTLVSGDTITTGSYRISTTDYASPLTQSKIEIGSSAVNVTDRVFDFGDGTRGWNITALQNGGNTTRLSLNARFANVLTETVRFDLNAPITGGSILSITPSGVSFAPTSGSTAFNTLIFNPTINQTGGANGVTRAMLIQPTLTAASDWRSIEWTNASGWGLYGSGTANNYLAGSLAIGSTNVFAKLYVAGGTTTATTQTYIGSQPTINQAVTNLQSFWSNIVGNLASTITNAHSYIATQSSIASSTITNLFGFTADSSLSVATNIYGFYGNIASGTGRWNLYMNGTAENYLAGNLLVGGTSVYGATITSYASAGRSGGIGIRNSAGTIAGGLFSYAAGSGSGSTDILVDSAGFISFSTASTERMKLFGATGNLSIGAVVTDSGEKLQVTGTAKITGATSIGGDLTVSAATNASILINTTSTSSFSDINFYESGSSKAVIQYINSAFATASRQNRLEFGGTITGGISFITTSNFTSPNMLLDGNGNLGIGGTANASAILQADSTTKGFLPPRMTTTQKNAIATPAAGLMVYDTTLNKLCVFTTAWETITSI